MTIKEAIRYMVLFREEWDKNSKTKNAEALDMAINALEEIEEYRIKEFQYHLAYEEGIGIGYNKAIDDFAKRIQSRKGYFEEYYPNVSIAISEANVYLEIANELKHLN